VAQAIAVVVAGAWAYWTFGLSEAPKLVPRLALSGGIKQYQFEDHPNHCDLEISASVTNTGNTTVEVKDVYVRVWFFDFPVAAEDFTFIDFADLEKHAPDWELPAAADAPLVRVYAPESTYNYSYDVFAPFPKKSWVYFKVTANTDVQALNDTAFRSAYYSYDCKSP
jgi:hypothetical protein